MGKIPKNKDIWGHFIVPPIYKQSPVKVTKLSKSEMEKYLSDKFGDKLKTYNPDAVSVEVSYPHNSSPEEWEFDGLNDDFNGVNRQNEKRIGRRKEKF